MQAYELYRRPRDKMMLECMLRDYEAKQKLMMQDESDTEFDSTLARGDNYMKWQVFDRQANTKDYFDPDSKCIIMKQCVLRNHKQAALRIFEGQNKTVCAWIDHETYTVSDTLPPLARLTNYKYNPRKNPHWFTDDSNNADNLRFKTMATNKRKVYG